MLSTYFVKVSAENTSAMEIHHANEYSGHTYCTLVKLYFCRALDAIVCSLSKCAHMYKVLASDMW